MNGRPSGARRTRRSPTHPVATQLADYVLAGVLIIVALHATGPMRIADLAGAGAAVVLGATLKAPLAAFPLVGPRIHRLLSVLVALGLVAAPFVARHHLSLLGTVGDEVAALALIAVARGSRRRDTTRHGVPGTVEARAVEHPRSAPPRQAEPPRPDRPLTTPLARPATRAHLYGRITGIVLRSLRTPRNPDSAR